MRTDKVRDYIMGYFNPEEYGVNTAEEALKKQVDYMMKNGGCYKSVCHTAEHIVEGGTFEVYYGDVENRLKEWGYKISKVEQKNWNLFKAVIATEICKILKE